MQCFNCHKKGHYSSKCPEKEKQEKKKAMIAISWGDSDLDAEQEEQKTRCLVADDDKISISKDKAYLKKHGV